MSVSEPWISRTCQPGLVSVVIPSYNRAHEITETLDSIFQQTYRPIELIVVDDGSTDFTQKVVEQWIDSNRDGGFTGRLYVSMDGTTAPTLDGWRAVKCGAVYWDDPIEGHQAQYVGRIEGCEFSGQRLWYLACRHALRQAKEVIVIGDGAEWVWNQSRLHFGRATEILDWFHASEHVWACANELYDQGSKKAKRWAARMLKTMRYQGGKGMLKGLRRSRRSRTTGHDALDSLIGYVCKHQERMDYPAYRRRGLEIGSGPIEATCKRLVNRRFKGAGMHWRPENVNAVVALRAAWLNHQWDTLWQAHPLAA